MLKISMSHPVPVPHSPGLPYPLFRKQFLCIHQIFCLYDALFFQAIDSYFTERVIDVLLNYSTQKDTIDTSPQITHRL